MIMVGNMVSIAENPLQENSFWWKPKTGLQPELLPCELVEISPTFNRNRFPNGGSGTFHQLIRPRRGSMQSEAFSEPVFQKQGKLITFFRGIILPKNLGKSKRKKKVFQVDLAEYLNCLDVEVPQVLTVCSEFIELKGCVDGVYRLSGISSNIQRLRRNFDEEKIPDLFNDRLVLQDIHSVSSLLKLYFRELPAPVCTFHLYDQFVAAVKASEEVRLYQLKSVIAQLPDANYSTLDYLMKHLHRVSLRHQDTGMTAKNLAIVWAPNLLRCQTLEAGGVEALQGVAIQAVVTEYLIKYCHVIFSQQSPTADNRRSSTRSYHQSFPISSPMKLLTLEEAQKQAHTINKRNQITPVNSAPQYRKKARPWKRKPLFVAMSAKDGASVENVSKGRAHCPCICDQSKLSTTPGSAYWEPVEGNNSADVGNKEQRQQVRYQPARAQLNIDHPVQFDIDMDACMETKTIPTKTGAVPDSPVILRCSRQAVGENMMDLSFREARSSLRDRFRKFALSPVSSLTTSEITGDHESDDENIAPQTFVKRLDLHRNDSLEYIDASSSEESEFEASPSTKRSKFNNRVQNPAGEIVKSDIKLNTVTSIAIKEGGEDKVERKLLRGDNNKANIKVTLDITSENNGCKTFEIKNFSKENKDMKQLDNDTQSRNNALTDASHAMKEQNDEGSSISIETKTVPSLKTSPCRVPGATDASKEQNKMNYSGVERRERVETYKEQRRNLFREKFKKENYLNQADRAVRVRSPSYNEKLNHTKGTSDLKNEFGSEKPIKAEIIKPDTQRDVKISRICFNKPPSKCSLSRQSLPEKLSDPNPHLPELTDTKVSTHKVVLRLSNSCPSQGQVGSGDNSSDKVDATKDELAGDAVNVKEMACVFEARKKELKTKPYMTLNQPLQPTAVPPSPSKIKSMAAIFEQNR